MMEYSGSVAGSKLGKALALGVGRCVTATKWTYPVPGQAWFLDCGAFTAYLQGLEYDAIAPLFRKCLTKIPAAQPPDFIVAPDQVGKGFASLRFSLDWLDELPPEHAYYLAVQDGMTPRDVEPHLDAFAGLFVGGTVDWKWGTAGEWIRLAHDHGLKAHVGRVGTLRHQVLARQLGADSIDSSSWAQNDSHHLVAAARAQRTLAPVTMRAAMKVLCYNTLWLHDVHVCRLPRNHDGSCRWSLLWPFSWMDDADAWAGLPEAVLAHATRFAKRTPALLLDLWSDNLHQGAKY